jgi:SAM-dependent methyltransferase
VSRDVVRVQLSWEELGRDDPFWAVLSWPGTEHGKWDVREFFATGERDVIELLGQAEAHAPGELRYGSALDFGSGLGRLTRALGERFERVVGVDISAPMTAQARSLVAGQCPNCEFVTSTSETLPFDDGRFDFIVTLLVLQHLPARLARRYVSELVRVLKPGGVLVFQVPTQRRLVDAGGEHVVRWPMRLLPDRVREQIWAMRRRGDTDVRELPMHAMSRRTAAQAIRGSRGVLLATIEDAAAGSSGESTRFVVTKAA